MTDITERLTERELQELRNTGNESERAADEITRLRAQVADLTTECVGLRVNEANLAAEVESLRQDAERYRWLADNARSTAEHWGGRWSLVIDGPAPTRNDCKDALDAAIDAAMKEQ